MIVEQKGNVRNIGRIFVLFAFHHERDVGSAHVRQNGEDRFPEPGDVLGQHKWDEQDDRKSLPSKVKPAVTRDHVVLGTAGKDEVDDEDVDQTHDERHNQKLPQPSPQKVKDCFAVGLRENGDVAVGEGRDQGEDGDRQAEYTPSVPSTAMVMNMMRPMLLDSHTKTTKYSMLEPLYPGLTAFSLGGTGLQSPRRSFRMLSR